nr:cadherin EGF LAG seven-pass G-type receptor 2-like [Procambarus clarkii]
MVINGINQVSDENESASDPWCPPTGSLRLEEPRRPPRVYAAAPSGVAVTVVRAVDDAHTPPTPAPQPRYFLYQSPQTDYNFFTIHEHGGNITTARYLEKAAGEEYHIIVVALLAGKAINKELTVTVTKYNQHAPRLALQHYSVEVLTWAEAGTTLVTVEAADDDQLQYNRHLHFFQADPHTPFHLDPFLDPP